MRGNRDVRPRLVRLVLAAALLAAAPAAVALAPANAAPGSTSGSTPASAAGPSRSAVKAACAPADETTYTCYARYRGTGGAGHARLAEEQPVLRPADIASAYRLPANLAPNTTVAIVVAYDNPKAEKDLAVYRKEFGLPPCTTANGCFRKVNQKGKAAPLPEGDPGWGVETSLDLDAVSAACPSCRLLLVEAKEPSFEDIGAAVNTAARLGASVINNSYGATEFNGLESEAEKYYTHPGVAQVASSGDYGFGPPSFPAIAPGVIGAGGTSLTKAPSSARGWKERVWAGAGSGCSGYVSKPAWQRDPNCPMRTSADVSAVADPDSGFLVYDTYGLGEDNGFITVGGTSLSSPLLAGMIARAGNPSAYDTAKPIYDRASSFLDVVGGRNGFCGRDYLCTGVRGYDAPTGVGTPNGLAGLAGP